MAKSKEQLITRNSGLPFGTNLQHILEDFDIKQSELGQKIGVSQTDVSAWITARCAPGLSMLYKIRDVLGVSFDDLLSDHSIHTVLSQKDELIYENHKIFYQAIFPEEYHLSMPDDYKFVCKRVMEDVLPERTCKILVCRFGLNGEQPKSYDATAEKFNLSRQRIDQIVKRALPALRKYKKYFMPVSVDNKTSEEVEKDLRLQYYTELKQALNECEQKINCILNIDTTPQNEKNKKDALEELDTIPIEYANLDLLPYNALTKRGGIKTIGGMLKMTVNDLCSIRGLGEKSLGLILDVQAEINKNPEKWLENLKRDTNIKYIIKKEGD